MSTSLAEFKHAAILNALRSCQLFAGLSAQDLNSVAGITVMKTLGRGDYLFRQGDPAHGFYIVQRGSVNVHRVNAAGREQVIHVFRTGESFAEGTLATDAGYPADARAVESSLVLQVQKSGFVALLRRHPELALKILASMALHLRVLVGQLEDLMLKDFETRLANWFVKRCPNPQGTQPVTIKLPMAKRMLAAELGTVSETLSRSFQKFRREKLITVKGSTVTVLNPSLLHELVKKSIGG
jgi:CRP/FNR family transcriptional regulator, dissimilatory nitrate respiration regulator